MELAMVSLGIIFLLIGVILIGVIYLVMERTNDKKTKEINDLKKEIKKLRKENTTYIQELFRDIKTPLNAIVGYSECVKQEKNIEDCYTDADNIISASNSLLDLINSKLNISKIDNNEVKVNLNSYNPSEVFNNIINDSISKINKNKVEFNYEVSNNMPRMLFGDVDKITQITTSLLNNSINNTSHGYINLKINVYSNNEECEIIIGVKDTSNNINEDQVNHNNNLNVSTIKNLVELMGGIFNYEYQKNVGSKFVVHLKQQLVKESKNSLLTSPKDISNKKVLIVDDNNLSVNVCKKILSAFNLDVSTVLSGAEAIELLKKGGKFDLILMDDMMPGMSGVETISKLKKEINSFSTPVVVLTANDVVENKEKYLNAGFFDTLSKPIEKEMLHRVLVKYLGVNNDNFKDIKEISNDNREDIDLTGKKILVVDDNNLNLKVTENFIKSYHPTIVSVNNGKDCINKVKSENYDLILIDDMMPGLSGTDTMKMLRNIKGFNTPIIIVTANVIDGAKDNYLTSGFDGYLAKPIDRNKLVYLLKKFIINKKVTKDVVKEDFKNNKDYLISNGINLKEALINFSSIDSYNSKIKDFLDSIDSKLSELDRLKQSHNLSSYSLVIHNIRIITDKLGIKELSDILYNHEYKSKNGNVRYVDENYKELVSILEKYINILKKYIGISIN